MHIAIRADGGPSIGYGHLVRTGALSQTLLERGHTVSYATTTPESVEVAAPDEVKRIKLPSRSNVESFLTRIDESVDAVVLDTYTADLEYQRAVRSNFPLALISDRAQTPICADLVINGNLYASSLEYRTKGKEPEWLLGPEYLLLRRAVRRLTKRDPPWREQPERAIITMGGSDMGDLTPTVIRAFDGADLRVEAIVGPGFSEQQEGIIRKAARSVPSNVHVVRNPPNLPERMFEADLAVATASTTTYELLALGTPIVAGIVAENQEQIANSIQKRDLATVVAPDCSLTTFSAAIKRYLNEPELRQRRQLCGCNLVDGHGVERVTDELERLVTE